MEQTGGNQPRVIIARVQAGRPARERLEAPIGRLGPGLWGGVKEGVDPDAGGLLGCRFNPNFNTSVGERAVSHI